MDNTAFQTVGSDTLAGPDGFVIPLSDCIKCGNIRPLRPVFYMGMYGAMCLRCRVDFFWMHNLSPWPRRHCGS